MGVKKTHEDILFTFSCVFIHSDVFPFWYSKFIISFLFREVLLVILRVVLLATNSYFPFIWKFPFIPDWYFCQILDVHLKVFFKYLKNVLHFLSIYVFDEKSDVIGNGYSPMGKVSFFSTFEILFLWNGFRSYFDIS